VLHYKVNEITQNIVKLINNIESTKSNTIEIKWIKGHNKSIYNELADRLAKLSRAEMLGPEPSVPIQTHEIKTRFNEYVRKKWQLQWQNSNGCKIAKKILSNCRKECKLQIAKVK